MIKEKDITPVGKFQKTHGLKGELNAVLDIDADFFADGNPLIVDVEGTFVPFYAESVRGKGATTSLIKINDLNSQEEAKTLVNEIIYAEKEKLKEYMTDEGEGLLLEEDLEGFRVVDEHLGEIGIITRVDTSTENILLVVTNKEEEEIFIPVADDFIVAIDDAKQEVITTLPEELINLNQKKI